MHEKKNFVRRAASPPSLDHHRTWGIPTVVTPPSVLLVWVPGQTLPAGRAALLSAVPISTASTVQLQREDFSELKFIQLSMGTSVIAETHLDRFGIFSEV